MAASVEIHKGEEVRTTPGASGWVLCFQGVTYHYDDGSPDEDGYRFIWRRPNGNLQAARGQARIPDKATHDQLIQQATAAGWF